MHLIFTINIIYTSRDPKEAQDPRETSVFQENEDQQDPLDPLEHLVAPDNVENLAQLDHQDLLALLDKEVNIQCFW